MSWVFSNEMILAVATWQWLLGAGLALSLAVVIKKYGAIRPASRYGVWACAFFTVALLPWAALLPGSKEMVSEPEASAPAATQIHAVSTLPPEPPPVQQALAVSESSHVVASVSQTPTPIADTKAEPAGPMPFVFDPINENRETSSFSIAENATMLLFGIWAMIAFFFFAKLVLAIQRLSVLKSEANPIEGPLQQWFASKLNQLQLKRLPRLMSHETIGSPLVAGLFRPAILIPEPLLHELSEEELQQILLHELAHVRRYDDWIHLFQKVILAVFWFHPALHWFSKQMAWDRESACDQWAISLTGKSKQYAQSLLRVSETMLQPHAGMLTVGAVRGRKQLAHRIESLISGKDGSRNLSPLAKTALFVLFSGCLASMAIAGPKLVWFTEPEPTAQVESAADEAELEREAQERLIREELEQLRQERAKLKRELAQLNRERKRAARSDASLNRDEISEHLAEAKARLEEQMAMLAEANQEDAVQLREKLEESKARVSELAKLERENLVHQEKAMLEAQKALEKAYSLSAEDQKQLRRKQAELEKQSAKMERELLRAEALSEKMRHKELQELERAQQRQYKEARRLQGAVQRQLEHNARHLADEHQDLMDHHHDVMVDHPGPDYVKTEHGYAFGSDKGKSRITMTNDNFKVEIRDQVTFSEDETTITHLSQRGYFKITDKRKPRQKHYLSVTPGNDGEPQFSYKLNRSKKPFDQAARSWLEATLPQVLIDLGIGADLRVQRTLAQEGMDGVFQLVKRIESDYAKESHIAALLAQADFTNEELGIVGSMIKSLDSDFHKARLLMRVAKHHPNHSELGDILTRTTSSMSSDFEKRRVLTFVLPNAEDQDMLVRLFDIAKSLSSDFEKRQVLTQAGRHFRASDLAEAGYLEVLERIQSDFEFSSGIAALTEAGDLSTKHAQALLKLASDRVQSDFEMTRIFNHLAEFVPVDDTFQKAFGRISSTHSKVQVLGIYIEKGNLSRKEQAQVLDAAKTISDDFQLAQVLKSFRDTYNLQGNIAKKFNQATATISNEHLRKDLSDY